jgi:hypothetical protein
MRQRRGNGVHTVPRRNGSGWVNSVGGEVVSRHLWQRTAVVRGRRIAMQLGTEHLIHGVDGRIRGKNSYGNDPCPPRDRK